MWQDKRVLSTNSDPRADGSVTRKTEKGNEEIEIACPQTVINYTKHMDVDVSDQKREYCGFGRFSKKNVEIYITFSPKRVLCTASSYTLTII